MFFVVIKDEPAFQKFIRDKYHDCSRGVDQILKLKKDARFIKLKHDSSSLDHWEMTKMIAPEIDKDDIDYFSPEHTLSVPHCHFHFCWKSELPLQPLNMKIRLVGADRPNNFFQGVPESNLIPFNYHMTF